MSRFKVGQRVWLESQRYTGEITTIYDNLYLDVDNEFMCITDLHETADDMFKALGYEVKKQKDYIIYQRKNGITTYNISFSLKDKEYACMFHNIGDYGNRLFIAINLHQAIHQMMIELGWL